MHWSHRGNIEDAAALVHGFYFGPLRPVRIINDSADSADSLDSSDSPDSLDSHDSPDSHDSHDSPDSHDSHAPDSRLPELLPGRRYVSWFDVITDALMADSVVRGVIARESAIITRAERDSSPLTCNDLRVEYASQSSRSATGIGKRAARIAGNKPPMSPISSA